MSSPTGDGSTRDVICIDLRNHGRTSAGYGSLPMDYPLMADDVRHTLAHLGMKSGMKSGTESGMKTGLGRVHLVGHSMGGKVAAALALALSAEQGLDASSSSRSDAGRASSSGGASASATASGISTSSLELLSLTIMDISPVDYTNEAAFVGVFSTLDTVRGE